MVIAWGEKDPWEPIALGKAYGEFDTVEDFIVLPNVGHCPQVWFLSEPKPSCSSNFIIFKLSEVS